MSTQALKTPELAAAGAERSVKTNSKTILPLPHAACLAGLTTLAICGLELAARLIFG
jgi:hypothetical protein